MGLGCDPVGCRIGSGSTMPVLETEVGKASGAYWIESG